MQPGFADELPSRTQEKRPLAVADKDGGAPLAFDMLLEIPMRRLGGVAVPEGDVSTPGATARLEQPTASARRRHIGPTDRGAGQAALVQDARDVLRTANLTQHFWAIAPERSLPRYAAEEAGPILQAAGVEPRSGRRRGCRWDETVWILAG